MRELFRRVIREKLNNLDFFSLEMSFALFYVLLFGAVPLLNHLGIPAKLIGSFQPSNENFLSPRTIFYLTLGLLFFLAGYRLNIFKNFSRKNSGFFKDKWDEKRTLFVFLICFTGGILIKAVRIWEGIYFHFAKNPIATQGVFYSLIGLGDYLGLSALAIVLSLYFYLLKNNNGGYKIWGVIAWVDLTIEFLYGFFSGSHFAVIVPIVIYLIVRHYRYEYSFFHIFAAMTLIFLVLMPAQNFYKNQNLFWIAYHNPSVADNQIAGQVARFVYDASMLRINQSHTIEAVFDRTTEFLYGKSFINFFISLGPPRFIWKSKPVTNTGGNEFGRAYGLLSPYDKGTTVGPTIVGDFYINFGFWGIAFGMFLLGISFRFIYGYLVEQTNFSLSGVMVYSLVWIQLIKGMEDWVAPVYAGLVKFFVIALVIVLLLRKKEATI